MSWPGENDPPTGGGGGRGRRRRADSPAEDPHQAAQSPGGTGRRGSGEFERPAEYVARAEQEAAAYDQSGQYDQYDQYGGYAEPAYYQSGTYQPQDSYQPAPDPYQQQSFYQRDSYQQDSYQQQPQAPYQAQSYGYASPGYAEAEAPAAYGSPNSSGFYQPTVPAQQPSYEQPAPSFEQPSFEQSAPSYEQPSHEQRLPPMPEPVVVPEKEPEEKDNDGEISNWLHFLEGDSRADRARRRRVRLISGAVALVLLVVAGVGSWLLFGGDDGAKATQTTVLLQVKDADGNAVGNVVLVAAKTEVAGGTDAKARGAALLIPAELTVESTALDSQPFGGAMPTTSPAGKDALSALIGVDVDGVWSLDPLTFASLLNNLIGVTIDVDPASAAAVLDPSGRPVFQPGKQDMTGDKAAYYATYRPKGEAPAKQLARFGQVVDGMLARIPKQASTTAAVLDSLAAVPDPALPNDRLAAILTALGGEEQTKRFDQQALPLRADGSGVMDLDAASGVVKQLLGGAARAKDQGGLTRVSVADGTGRADTVTSRAMAASKLLGYGYTPVDQGVAAGTPTTYVLVPNQDATSVGKQVALALGLAETEVRVQPFDTTLTDVRVVLGADWTQIGQVPADQAPSPSDTAPAANASGSPSASAGAPSGADTGGKSSSGKASTSRKPTSSSTR
ncbi:hypothetical protein GCM10009839_12270 [Catenulispora yoronensis]|uniref:LytR/CpsA/Psr regulator C-terminal domain-containing protein n=1 Tax=Catenulispora yoronensis TaxID=450799 RepID=A0ABN2TRE4_9ACTN